MKKTFEEKLREAYIKEHLSNSEILERASIIDDPKEKAEFIRQQKAKRDKIKVDGFPKATVSQLQNDGTWKEVEPNTGKNVFDVLDEITPFNRIIENTAFEKMQETKDLIKEVAELTEENSNLYLENEAYRIDDEAYIKALFNEAESRETQQSKIDFLIQAKYKPLNNYRSKFRPGLSENTTQETILERIDKKIEELKANAKQQPKQSKIEINLEPFQFAELVKSLTLAGIVKGKQQDIIKEFAEFFRMENQNTKKVDDNLRTMKRSRKQMEPIFLSTLRKKMIDYLLTENGG